jgi:hypothetical protein
VLEDRTGHDLTQPFAGELEAVDEPIDRGGEHLLVGRVDVAGVGPGERNPVATEDGDATR